MNRHEVITVILAFCAFALCGCGSKHAAVKTQSYVVDTVRVEMRTDSVHGRAATGYGELAEEHKTRSYTGTLTVECDSATGRTVYAWNTISVARLAGFRASVDSVRFDVRSSYSAATHTGRSEFTFAEQKETSRPGIEVLIGGWLLVAGLVYIVYVILENLWNLIKRK